MRRFVIEQLSEGQFELFPDGTINRTPVDATPASTPVVATAQPTQYAGINPVYVSDGIHHVLLDTGLGWGLDARSSYGHVSNVVSNLQIFGIDRAQITHVILSHLHYDHAAGASFTDEASRTQPTFPNATYVVRESEWAYATARQQQPAAAGEMYHLDDLYRLYSDGFFQVLADDDTAEIIPGVTLHHTGGHTPGHQVVHIQSEGESAWYLGDLVRDEKELNADADTACAGHAQPQQAKKARIQNVTRIADADAYLLFYHAVHSSIGTIEQDEQANYRFRKK